MTRTHFKKSLTFAFITATLGACGSGTDTTTDTAASSTSEPASSTVDASTGTTTAQPTTGTTSPPATTETTANDPTTGAPATTTTGATTNDPTTGTAVATSDTGNTDDTGGSLCTLTGGAETRGLCCASVESFPDSCLEGACGCSPDNSHMVTTCTCPAGQCYDAATGCVDEP